jgi:hypothetical protein
MEENELTSFWAFLFAVIGFFPFACRAQQAPSDIPDDPKPSLSIDKRVAGTFGYVFARNLIRELFDHP